MVEVKYGKSFSPGDSDFLAYLENKTEGKNRMIGNSLARESSQNNNTLVPLKAIFLKIVSWAVLCRMAENSVDLFLMFRTEVNRQKFFDCFDICTQVFGKVISCVAAGL